MGSKEGRRPPTADVRHERIEHAVSLEHCREVEVSVEDADLVLPKCSMDLGEAGVGELCFGALEERAHELRPLLRGALELVRAQLDDLLDALVVGPGPQRFRRRCIVLAIHPPAVHQSHIEQIEDGQITGKFKTAVELHVDIKPFR